MHGSGMIAQLDNHYLQIRPWKVYSRLISYALFEGRPATTKGRWINPIVFAHLRVEQAIPTLKKVIKPLFIVGTGRSGSTVLGIILSMHRDVGFLNEPKALWHSVFKDEDVIGSYSRRPARYRLLGEDVTPIIIRNAERLFGAYLAITNSRRIVDKYPEIVFRIPFVKNIFPDAKFIFLVRDGWDTCKSIMDWSISKGSQLSSKREDWWGVNNRKWRLMVEELVETAPYFSRIKNKIRQN